MTEDKNTLAMSPEDGFVVTAKSRFDESFQAYDSQSHRYNPNYVNPQTRRILLEANPRDHREGIFEWRVQQLPVGQIFRKASQNLRKVGFNLPTLGEYECSLTIKFDSGGSASYTHNIVLSDSLIVSIGESAASGQGNPDEFGRPKKLDTDLDGWGWFNPWEWGKKFTEVIDWAWNRLQKEFTTLAAAYDWTIDMDPEPVWLEPNVHRSMRSGPAIAARKLEDPQNGNLVTFLSFARSGAEIEAGLLGPRRNSKGEFIDGWIDNIGQMAEVKRAVGDRAIDALIISIGGNDIGFADGLKALVSGDLFWNIGDDSKTREEVIKESKRKLDKLATSFERLAAAISALNVRRVYLTEYPTALFDQEENGRVFVGEGCGIFGSSFDADIDLSDARKIKGVAKLLNDFLRNQASRHGWIFVGGIAEAFEGRGYCMGKRRLYVQAEESLAIQGDLSGTMHPNKEGHHIYARQIQKAFTKRDSEPRIWREPTLHVIMSE